MDQIPLGAVFVFALICLLMVWLARGFKVNNCYMPDRDDITNRFKRQCVFCGQRQVFSTYAGEIDDGWWESVGPTFRPDCACHLDTETTEGA